MSQGSTSLPPRTSSRQTPSKPNKQKKQKKKRSILKTFFVLLFGLLLIVAAALVYLVFKTDDAIKQIGADNNTVVIPEGESVKEKAVGLVIMGLDSRTHGGGLNTDVMMVASFNPTSKTATVVSIPRDSRIDVDGYKTRKANGYYAAFYNTAIKDGMKKEAAHAEAKRHMREMMSDFFGIDVKYSAVINFQGFVDVVDVLGGVEVDVDMRMKYKSKADGTDIDLQKGFQVLDGDDALDFVRYRQSNDGTNMSSDFDRNKRQSDVLGALADKMKSLGGITKIDKVIDAVGDNMTMDMPSSEIKAMIASYFGMGRSDITFIPLEGDWKSPYVYLDDQKLAEARSALQAKMAE
ncbi:LCP family protein [Paenibacillus harenae]|uniref:LCP family protein required for cell wall assembly n=1 Tax=Paenibacillus harenae TaxID=306543 RepID=A0ABT9TZQ0_PAEHA|nr:LCP family protein [Paenibacillus harenae]MDQ0112846.1 LCP family protein required for cell wall assembly [Paenibacillus harenae]